MRRCFLLRIVHPYTSTWKTGHVFCTCLLEKIVSALRGLELLFLVHLREPELTHRAVLLAHEVLQAGDLLGLVRCELVQLGRGGAGRVHLEKHGEGVEDRV